MRDAGEPDLVPFFGCQPHTPGRTLPPSKGPAPRDCPTCNGADPEGSPFVCMGCHGVAPEHQARFNLSRVKAATRREPERNLLRATAAELPPPRRRRSNPELVVFTAKERAQLAREFPDLAPDWLRSIGQAVPTAAELDHEAARARRKRKPKARA